MKPKTLVMFTATGFPDDSRWRANGSPLVPEGQGIADALVTALRAKGLEVSNAAQHQFYGWCFEVAVAGGVEWCLLQQPDPWLLLVRQKRSLLHRLLRVNSDTGLTGTLLALNEVLKTDGRFSAVQWLTEEAFDSGSRQGTESPF